jgi:anti-sigma factor RsiW
MKTQPTKEELLIAGLLRTEARQGGAARRAADCLPAWAIAAFAEGRLLPAERQTVEKHLADCGHCLAQLAASLEPVASDALDDLSFVARAPSSNIPLRLCVKDVAGRVLKSLESAFLLPLLESLGPAPAVAPVWRERAGTASTAVAELAGYRLELRLGPRDLMVDVLDEWGNAQPGARVTLRLNSGREVTAQADREGRAVFASLAPEASAIKALEVEVASDP